MGYFDRAGLKSQPGKDFLLMGSGVLVQTLMQHRLVDLYVLLIHPLILGSGRHLFPDGIAFAALRLVDVKPTSNGVVIATYQPDDWETQILLRLMEIPIYDLSRVTGIDQGNLTLFASGKRRPNEENMEKIRQGLLRVTGRDEWKDEILPCLKKMTTCEVVRLTGLSYRQIQLLKSSKRHPSKDILEKLERVSKPHSPRLEPGT